MTLQQPMERLIKPMQLAFCFFDIRVHDGNLFPQCAYAHLNDGFWGPKREGHAISDEAIHAWRECKDQVPRCVTNLVRFLLV